MAPDHLGTPQAPTFGLAPLADLYRQTLAECGHDPLPIGSHRPGHVAETVATKIAWAVRTLGPSGFRLKHSVGSRPFAERLSSVRSYGERVVQLVREQCQESA